MKNIIFAFLTILVFACDDENLVDNPALNIDQELSQLQYTGQVAADGCGWLLEADSSWYSPSNILNDLLIDGLFINSKLSIAEGAISCGLVPNVFSNVTINKLPTDDAITIYWNETQCADPWASGQSSDLKTVTEMINYLKDQNIDVYTVLINEIEQTEPVCEACNCASGREFVLKIDPTDLIKATELGFI